MDAGVSREHVDCTVLCSAAGTDAQCCTCSGRCVGRESPRAAR